MDKNKLSFYASFVVFGCGMLVILLQFFSGFKVDFRTFIGLIFTGIGILGIRFYKNKG